MTVRPGDPALARRLARAVEGEVLFDPFSRGRYATDASIYQVEPLGVVVARTAEDIRAVIEIAADEGVPVLPRGAGTSQCGQTVGEAIVVDTAKYLDRMLDFDAQAKTVTVEPGVVLDRLNRWLAPHGLLFPIDVSPANRATIGGMAGNNSAGARSIRYGIMVQNVRAIEAVLASGETARFAEVPADLDHAGLEGAYRDLVARMRALAAREAGEIAARMPKLLRRVGGYNIDSIDPRGHNMARLLVGSEGTLAFFTRITLDLHPIPAQRVLGVCHFPTFRGAMEAVAPIVALGPSAVELVDPTMVRLARDIAAFRPTVEAFVRGAPGALLLVEFAGEEAGEQRRALRRLVDLMADLGHPGAVVEAVDPAFQKAVWEVRKAGLNILMSMKGDGKPVSFIEDCAVPLDDLADYTERLDAVFRQHGVRGTWYAHASVGTLHVRPVLNLKRGGDVAKMRAIAEEAFAMVREYKGSHSGEHGDGIVRSEFHPAMFGERVVGAFEAVKDAFDPQGLFNPGKIVRPWRMDDRSLLRFKPGYAPIALAEALDWSPWGGFARAVEMCNNNGTCRKRDAGVMCPSFRAMGDEVHLTRGRANSLRLALSGQLGEDAFTAPEMAATMALCLGCKACKRECPTGVDMARMKIEFLHHYHRRHGLSARERLIAYLPRWAPWAAGVPVLANAREWIPGLRAVAERALGLAARRALPRFRRDRFRASEGGTDTEADVVLFPDTFTTWFEPEVPRAALRVLRAAGLRVAVAAAPGRPLCCGRTFLAAGLIDEARVELRRTLAALAPWLARGVPIVGLEPSCLGTFLDEAQALLGAEAAPLAAAATPFEAVVGAHAEALSLTPTEARALVHGHCHQKALATFGCVPPALSLVPGLAVETMEAGCCGMAGAFGYRAETYEVSMRIGEIGPLPMVRAAEPETLIVADGFSCRHQIREATGRAPRHAAQVLAAAL